MLVVKYYKWDAVDDIFKIITVACDSVFSVGNEDIMIELTNGDAEMISLTRLISITAFKKENK